MMIRAILYSPPSVFLRAHGLLDASFRGNDKWRVSSPRRARPRSHVKEHFLRATASLLEREQGLRGTVSLRPIFVGSLAAPRCGDILMPMPRRLTSVSARATEGSLSELTWASHPRRPRVRTPEAGPLAGARSASGFATLGVRAHLRRRVPSPKIQTVCSSRPHGQGTVAV
jgi:hypothetical protein